MVTRQDMGLMTLGQLTELAMQTPEVDGIPMAVTNSLMTHRVGMFSMKNDIEAICEDRAVHDTCVNSQTSSSDDKRTTAILYASGRARTLLYDAYDAYDEARYWPHP